MRIGYSLLGATFGTTGGVAVYARELLIHLAKYDDKNSYVVLTQTNHQPFVEGEKWPRNFSFVCIQELPRAALLIRGFRWAAREIGLWDGVAREELYIGRQIDGLSLDLVHYPATIIRPLSISAPCVLTFFDLQHEYYPEFFARRELKSRRRVYKPSVDRAVRVIVPSLYTKQSLIEKYGTPPSKMVYVVGGISGHFVPAKSTEIENLRKKYALPDRFAFYPANPWPHKNHVQLFAALRIYKSLYGTSLKLVLTGKLSGEKTDVWRLARAAGVNDDVIDLGYIPYEDLPAFYSAASLLVFPSLFEGFGIPLVEAMACGCPITCANVTAIPECVGEAAVLFDPLEPEDIARSMHMLAAQKDLRRDLIQKGFERVKRFSWREVVPRVVSVYEEALEIASR